jgi:AcrR family transcriptional regulator
MPRIRSDDYEVKAQAIMDAAAAIFAKEGYPAAKMQDVAKACGATKSMLYHYFPTKDDLLFAMLQEHLQGILTTMEGTVGSGANASQRLQLLVEDYTQKSTQSRRRHVVAMNDVKFLPKAKQTPLIQLQRKLSDLVSQLLTDLNPGLPQEVYKPYAMMLLGMLNWSDLWYKPSGPIKPQELCDRMTRLFTTGFMAEKA